MFPYFKFIESIIKKLPEDKVSNVLVLGAGGFTIGIDDERNQYTYLDIEKTYKKFLKKSSWVKN